MEEGGALSQKSEAAAAQLRKRKALVPIKSHYCRLERRGAAASIDMSGWSGGRGMNNSDCGKDTEGWVLANPSSHTYTHTPRRQPPRERLQQEGAQVQRLERQKFVCLFQKRWRNAAMKQALAFFIYQHYITMHARAPFAPTMQLPNFAVVYNIFVWRTFSGRSITYLMMKSHHEVTW